MSSETQDLSKLYNVNDRFEPVGDKNVWVEFTQLARDYRAINLGQGYFEVFDFNKKILFNSAYN